MGAKPSPENAGKVGSADISAAGTELVCPCANLTLEQFQHVLASRPDLTFETLLKETGAGTKCTACLLNLEYYFVALPRVTPMDQGHAVAQETVTPHRTIKSRIYHFVDSVSPLMHFPLLEPMPVLFGNGIEQWFWLANYSLLYEGEVCAPPMVVDLTIRDSEGHLVEKRRLEVEPEAALREGLSQALSLASPDDQELGIGSVMIRRRGRSPGIRGTTRPQIQIISPQGDCALHSQRAKDPREGWFTALSRPKEERLFLAFVNVSRRLLPIEISYPFAPQRAAGKEPDPVHLNVPPLGARLHEIILAEEDRELLDEQPFSIRWRAFGSHCTHAICASPDLGRFSIDHV